MKINGIIKTLWFVMRLGRAIVKSVQDTESFYKKEEEKESEKVVKVSPNEKSFKKHVYCRMLVGDAFDPILKEIPKKYAYSFDVVFGVMIDLTVYFMNEFGWKNKKISLK